MWECTKMKKTEKLHGLFSAAVWYYNNDICYKRWPFGMFNVKWSGCIYRTKSNVGLKWHAQRCLRTPVEKNSSVKASSLTKSEAMKPQVTATKREGEGLLKDVGVIGMWCCMILDSEILHSRKPCNHMRRMGCQILPESCSKLQNVAWKSHWIEQAFQVDAGKKAQCY